MRKRKNGFLTDNYIERWEFTKIEIILLAGTLLIFLPFVLLPINDNITEIEKLVVMDENGKYDNAKKAILNELDIVDQEIKYEKAKELILAKLNDDITIENKKKELAIEDEERIREVENRIKNIEEDIERVDESIYKHLKSTEYENRIYIAFVIAMFLLILTVYLSRKGYTSYTPWLEKLANDKLQFDLQLYQYVEYEKIEKFYRETFRVKKGVEVDESQLLGWKPVNEDEKWYSVFSEKLDYRFYELAFEKLWPEWSEGNYNKRRNGVGEYEPKYNRRRELYDNPELVPNMNNEEIKNELEKTGIETERELENTEIEINEKLEELENLKKELKEFHLLQELEELSEVTKQELNELKKELERKDYRKGKLVEKIRRAKNLKKEFEESNPNIVKDLEEKLLEKIQELVELKEEEERQHKEMKAECTELEKTKKELENYDRGVEKDVDKKLVKIIQELCEIKEEVVKKNAEKNQLEEELEKVLELKEKLIESYRLKEKSKNEYPDPVKKFLDEELEVIEKELDDLNKKLEEYNASKLLELEKQKEEENRELNKAVERLKSEAIKDLEKQFKKVEARKNKLESRIRLFVYKKVNPHKTCLDVILNEMDIFKKDEKNKEEIEKILIRKIQNDIFYYAVMVNFRRGLQKATTKWLEADESLKTIEKNRIRAQAEQKDVGGWDLERNVLGIIESIKEELVGKNNTKTSSSLNLIDTNYQKSKDNQPDTKNESEYIAVSEKIDKIQNKLINRNVWETPEWRAMGSIYWKWKEDGDKDRDQDGGIEKATKTISERRKAWINRRKGIKKEPEFDPTEVAWIENRTIRAVNSLSQSFGFEKNTGTGKAIVFFGVVFALIISVALTNSLDIVIEALQLPADCDDCWHTDYEFLKSNFIEYQYVIILLLCFFPLGILFYHQGIIFLSANASEELTLGNKPLIFVNFLVILLQAIVVYFLASSIGDVNAFLSLLMLLVFIDLVWVGIFTWNDMRDAVRDAPVYLEWIIFDIVIGMFALVFAINYASSPVTYAGGWEQNFPIFLMLLIVLVTRAAVDYSYGWKNFWSKFADAE